MVIRYCEKCGIHVRDEAATEAQVLCPDCQAGKVRVSRYLRDSDMIPNRLRFRRAFAKQFAAPNP